MNGTNEPDVDDAFAEISRLRAQGAPQQQSQPAPAAKVDTTVAPVTTGQGQDVVGGAGPSEKKNDAAETAESRTVLVGVYVDPQMDDFLEHYASQRIAQTRKRPSRSLIGYWLMQLGMEALEARGRPPMPAEFAKRRR